MSKSMVSPKKKADDQEIAERMLRILESQRVLGGDAYPPTLGRLAELCDLRPSDPLVKKAANKKTLTEQAIVARKDKGKPVLDAPVVLKDDIESVSKAFTSALLLFTLRDFEPKVKNRVFSVADLKKRIAKSLHKTFQEGVNQGIAEETLPSEIAWVQAGTGARLFLVGDLQPTSLRETLLDNRRPAATPTHNGPPAVQVPPKRDFAEAFREAFDRLDRDNGGTNFVMLSNLRRSLPEFDRASFDSGLREIRIDGLFSLDSHEGLTGPLTPEEREAGVQEAGSLLVYVSRR